MKLSLLHLASLTAALAVASGASMSLASCASDEDGALPTDDASVPVPTPDGGDAATEASCEGVACGPAPLSCAEADWCPVATGVDARYALTAVWGTSATDVWAVGSGGTLVHHDGSAWSVIPSGVPETFNAVWGTSATDVWFVASAARILHFEGFAAGVARITATGAFGEGGYGGRMLGISGTSRDDVRVVGESFGSPDFSENGNHLRKAPLADGGVKWEILAGLDSAWPTATLHAVWSRSATDVWMTVDDLQDQSWLRGMVFRGRPGDAGDGGALAWRPIESQSSQPLEGLWGASNGEMWAVGAHGAIRRWQEGAERFEIVPSTTTETLHAVWGTSANDVWAVGDDGVLLHFDGTAFRATTTALPRGKKPRVLGVWGSGPNDVWAVGDGALLHFTGHKSKRGGT